MADKSKKSKKGFVSEEDVSSLLQRYSATTVLALLQEVAQVQDVNIDWKAMVKNTNTGITNPREYQMLWRHLAYRDTISDQLVDTAEPLDDDSDLEFEVEAFPSVSNDASVEAAACVKVLIASGLPPDSSGTTVEAPLTINIPNGQTLRASSENPHMHGTNITVPVSVQKQPLPTTTCAEPPDNGTNSGTVVRKKRKPWSEEEDQELIEAVKKCGEGNWANILKGDFKGDRTASQLSQRWNIIRKRKGNLAIGNGEIAEKKEAARVSMYHALDMPMGDNPKATSSIGQRLGIPVSSRSQVPPKVPSTKSALSPDSMVKAAAVAAGARIATPSDAASLLKAAQSKNAVHIMPGGSNLMKSSVTNNTSPLPSNVHFIRTGLATTPLSSYSANSKDAAQAGTTQPVQSQFNPAAPTVQPKQIGVAAASPTTEHVVKAEVAIVSSSDNTVKEQLREGQGPIGSVSGELIAGNQAALSGCRDVGQVQDQGTFGDSESKVQIEDKTCGQENALSIKGSQTSLSAGIPKVQENHVAAGTLRSEINSVNSGDLASAGPTGNDHPTDAGNQNYGECQNMNDINITPLPVLKDGCNDSTPMEVDHDNQSMKEAPATTSMVIDGNDVITDVNKEGESMGK